ncbi:hypothetical protein WG66_009462 [Moniliophthora roreri]|nr:hypothetical protein WG66_009462 [Moniliophthora roreri]
MPHGTYDRYKDASVALVSINVFQDPGSLVLRQYRDETSLNMERHQTLTIAKNPPQYSRDWLCALLKEVTEKLLGRRPCACEEPFLPECQPFRDFETLEKSRCFSYLLLKNKKKRLRFRSTPKMRFQDVFGCNAAAQDKESRILASIKTLQ